MWCVHVGPQLSEYEERRLQNIQRNNEFLRSMLADQTVPGDETATVPSPPPASINTEVHFCLCYLYFT